MTRNFVDVLQKQRVAKDKNWVFACLPYQQRVAKLMADEFVLPLGHARRMVQVGVGWCVCVCVWCVWGGG
jgi:hypothetical protein